MYKSTPCVGICSTTYGDLVCRGCKRFAHEIVEWNGFDADQRSVVWLRLHELREGAVAHWLRVCDHDALSRRAEIGGVRGLPDMSSLALAYEVLRNVQIPLSRLAELGIKEVRQGDSGGWTQDLVRHIDREFYLRSLAHYEHNFKIAAQ